MFVLVFQQEKYKQLIIKYIQMKKSFLAANQGCCPGFPPFTTYSPSFA